MKLELICAWYNLLRLVRFLVLYAGTVAAFFYLLPMAAAFLQSQYELVSSAVKVGGTVVFLLAVAAWQLRARRQERGARSFTALED